MAEQIFTTPKVRNSKYIFLQIMLNIFGAAVLVSLFIAWKGVEKFPLFLWVYAPITLFIHYYHITRLRYINEIGIDTEKRTIRFSCYQFSKGNKEFTKPFGEVKMEIIQYLFPRKLRNPKIYFFKNKPGDFYVSAAKDGFSRKTMNEIAALLTDLTTPVNRK
jgi:hypothetical protein